MKRTKEILVFYFIILFLSHYPVTKEIEICRIGGNNIYAEKEEVIVAMWIILMLNTSQHVLRLRRQMAILVCVFV